MADAAYANVSEYLNGAQARRGAEYLKNAFRRLCERDARDAIRLLADERLRFSTLYILRPEIGKLALEPFLGARNVMALGLADAFASRKKHGGDVTAGEYPVLRWMFATGHEETSLGEEYDAIMDSAAILLVRERRDTSCLPMLEKMIFERNRNGLYTFDAEWAFFESRDPDCLIKAANRLLSTDYRDVELAQRMLRFIPSLDEDADDPAAQHRLAMQWIAENRPYLCYTGESNQNGCCPCRYKVLQAHKYLQTPQEGGPGAQEPPRLLDFEALDEKTQAMLSGYSHRLHMRSVAQWKAWMRYPLPRQIETAREDVRREARHG